MCTQVEAELMPIEVLCKNAVCHDTPQLYMPCRLSRLAQVFAIGKGYCLGSDVNPDERKALEQKSETFNGGRYTLIETTNRKVRISSQAQTGLK